MCEDSVAYRILLHKETSLFSRSVLLPGPPRFSASARLSGGLHYRLVHDLFNTWQRSRSWRPLAGHLPKAAKDFQFPLRFPSFLLSCLTFPTRVRTHLNFPSVCGPAWLPGIWESHYIHFGSNFEKENKVLAEEKVVGGAEGYPVPPPFPLLDLPGIPFEKK